jgi:hypothetical protein
MARRWLRVHVGCLYGAGRSKRINLDPRLYDPRLSIGIMLMCIGWLSPELYLRRPPAKNEQYRLDRMLQRAAQRGVRINIIVYKEVSPSLSGNKS